MEAVARVLGLASATLHPACAAAIFVGGGEIFLREGLAGAQQFYDSVAELRARGPGLIDAGAGEHIR